MNRDAFLSVLEACLLDVRTRRYYESERGFQGELLARLRAQLPPGIVSADAILEQEHQKRLAEHGLDIRPDLIVHEPFDPTRHQRRDEGIFVVLELKRRSTRAQAREDFESLGAMFHALNYRLGIFVNIDSQETFALDVPQPLHGRVVCYAVQLDDDGNPRLIVSHT